MAEEFLERISSVENPSREGSSGYQFLVAASQIEEVQLAGDVFLGVH
jgi:hypothetical protein